MSARAFIFTVRYYPSTLRSEFVSVGVAVLDVETDRCTWSWLKGWRRASVFAGHDVQLATQIYRDEVEGQRWTLIQLINETNQRGGAIVLCGPRPSLLPADQALEFARADELIDVFDRHAARGTDRRRISRRAADAARQALGKRRADLVHFVEEHYVIEGRSRTREFDLAIKNSIPLHILQSFSFDVANQDAVLGEFERMTFAVTDVRQAVARAATPFTFAVLPPKENTYAFESALKVAEDNGIAVIAESEIDAWADVRAEDALAYALAHASED